jgi:hypothetical protein
VNRTPPSLQRLSILSHTLTSLDFSKVERSFYELLSGWRGNSLGISTHFRDSPHEPFLSLDSIQNGDSRTDVTLSASLSSLLYLLSSTLAAPHLAVSIVTRLTCLPGYTSTGMYPLRSYPRDPAMKKLRIKILVNRIHVRLVRMTVTEQNSAFAPGGVRLGFLERACHGSRSPSAVSGCKSLPYLSGIKMVIS